MDGKIKGIIEDIYKSLDNDCYYAALSLALMLPDICAQAEYPKMSLGNRYIKWFDEFYSKYEKEILEENSAYLIGEVLYNLRCSFLHIGNPAIKREKIKEEQNKNIRIFLFKDDNKDHIPYRNIIFPITINQKSGTLTATAYFINIRGICLRIAAAADKYYENNIEKFNFINSSLLEISDGSLFDIMLQEKSAEEIINSTPFKNLYNAFKKSVEILNEQYPSSKEQQQ